MDPSSYTIVFVPGAWHSARCFEPVGDILKCAGFNIDYVELPSVGPSKHLTEFGPDVEAIRQHISKAASKGKKVVVVAHSYGGIPSAEAIGLVGKDGPVAHFFLCCSFIIPKDKSLIAAFGGNDLPWWSISDDRLEVQASTPEDIFYNDLSPEQVSQAIKGLKPHSYQVFHSPLKHEGWRVVPTTYLYCTKDAAIPLQIQKHMVEETAKGVNIRTPQIDAAHSPFFNMPADVASAIQDSIA